MSNGLERRLSRLEHVVAERTKPRICNCREETQYHDADCLDRLLKRMPRVCPIHSFRDLGSLQRVFLFFPLISGDRQFCPCPPDRWRSFVLGKGPSTIEDKMMAVHVMLVEASLNIPDQSDSHGYCLRTEALKAKYWKARQQWIEKTGRQLRGRAELEKESLRRIAKFIHEGNKVLSLRYQREISDGWINDYESSSFLRRLRAYRNDKSKGELHQKGDLGQDSTPVSTKPGNVEELQESLVR
jgi:hypothetical protein